MAGVIGVMTGGTGSGMIGSAGAVVSAGGATGGGERDDDEDRRELCGPRSTLI